MNAGFSNLADLKVQLLNESLRAETTYDALILAIGVGVAGKIAGACNRQFAREAGGFYTTTGNRQSLLLPRYPVEAITAVEVRDRAADDWTDELAALDYFNPDSGLVQFATPLDYGQIRVTYTGGYHWETLEPTDDGYPTAVPEGAALLPDAVRSAWILQCQHIWRRIDKLGISLAAPESNKLITGMADLTLVPLVVEMLRDHVRYALT